MTTAQKIKPYTEQDWFT